MVKRSIFWLSLALLMIVLASCGSGDSLKTDPATGEVLLGGDELAPAEVRGDHNPVFYEIFVGSFSDSDGDGTGDLRGIIERMDYLNDGDPASGKSLGVEGIWLTPIFKSPSYHKYDVTDYLAIDSSFGSMEDLEELIRVCHERGVKVILDLVINHTGKNNEWFRLFTDARKNGAENDPYYDFYSTRGEGMTPGRNYAPLSGTDVMYECNFSTDMPELNFDNPAVREEVLKIAEFYLEKGVDGFRFDAAKYIYLGQEPDNAAFWEWYLGELREDYPALYTVAEVWDSDPITLQYAGSTSCFDFTVSQAEGLISSTAKKGNVNTYTAYVEKYMKSLEERGDCAVYVPFISNHDMDRSAGYNTLASGYAEMAANLYLLGPGTPFIYYGEEIGMKGTRGAANTDANRRLAMLWGDGDTVKDPMGTTYGADKQTNGTVKSQSADPESLYSHYKKLLMIRRAHPAIADGTYEALYFEGLKLGGFVASDASEKVAVIHNTSGATVTVDLSEVLAGEKPVVSVSIGAGGASLDGSVLTMDGQTSTVLLLP